MSKIVIFGGNGYIGRAFVRRLLQSSSVAGPFSVVLASRSGVVTQQFPERETIKVSTAKAEVSDYKTVSDLCSGASTVINLVGLLEETPSNQFKQVQLDGAVNVAKAAKLSGSNLLHLSAIGADENSDIPYAKTKALAEAEITKLFNDAKDQFAVMLRPSLVLGEEDQFLNKFHVLLKFAPAFPLFGGGMTKYQPILIEDLVQIMHNVALNNVLAGGAHLLEIGGKETFTFKQLLELSTRKPETESLAKELTPPILFPLPFPIAKLQAAVLERVTPYGSFFRLTTDQIKLLEKDNVVADGSQLLIVKSNTKESVDALKQRLFKGCTFKLLRERFKNGQWTK